MERKVVVGIVAAMALTGIILILPFLSSNRPLPVPPDSLEVADIPSRFECSTLEVSGYMPIYTTPEGLSLEGGTGMQLLAQHGPSSKTMVYVAFMKVPSNEAARRVAKSIVDYVYRFKEKYTSWDYDIGGRSGYAYFDYPGLRWEMWYSGRWIVEVGVGRSGEEGRWIIGNLTSCIVEIKG